MEEIFKPIPETDNKYHVSNLGNVKGPTGVIRKLSEDRHGYYKLRINRRHYGVHQLVAMAFLNHKPCGHKVVVDHINNNKLDNRLENLRLVSTRENLSRRGGASKYVGVSKFRDKWMSAIRINNKLKYLGLYKTEEEAHMAYVKRLNEI